jgi:hypothetical protein
MSLPDPKSLKDRLTSTALAGVVLEAQAQRRAARLEAAQQAREEAERRVRHQQVAETVNLPFLAAVQHWMDPETLGQRPEPVREALTGIGETTQELMRTAAGPAIASGETPWNEARPGLFEQLLAAGETTRPSDPKLTIEISTVLLAAKPASRASWRMRALAGENAGDLPTAIQAHQSYLNLTHGEKLGVMERVRKLQERDDRRLRLIKALTATGKGTLPPPAPRILKMLERPTPRGELDRGVAQLVKTLAALPIDELSRPATQDVLYQASRWKRHVEVKPPPLDEDTARGLDVLRLNDLRQRLDGSRLCLLTDAAYRLRGTGLGERVDGYDVVVRLGAVRTGPKDGGNRTDLQVIRHDAKDGWDTEAWLRLILADDPRDWVAAVRTRLIPGRQHAVAEKVLRRPLRYPVGDDAPARSEAYQLIRLLDVLAACERIDLIGFRPDEDFTEAELAWLAPRLERLDDHAIGVR